jgi:hypothetical protein
MTRKPALALSTSDPPRQDHPRQLARPDPGPDPPSPEGPAESALQSHHPGGPRAHAPERPVLYAPAHQRRSSRRRAYRRIFRSLPPPHPVMVAVLCLFLTGLATDGTAGRSRTCRWQAGRGWPGRGRSAWWCAGVHGRFHPGSESAQPDSCHAVIGSLMQDEGGPGTGGLDVLDEVDLVNGFPDLGAERLDLRSADLGKPAER